MHRGTVDPKRRRAHCHAVQSDVSSFAATAQCTAERPITCKSDVLFPGSRPGACLELCHELCLALFLLAVVVGALPPQRSLELRPPLLALVAAAEHALVLKPL